MPVTEHTGRQPVESPDGQSLYYLKAGGIWRASLTGGLEAKVVDSVRGVVTVIEEGIYFLAESGTESGLLDFFEFSTGIVRPVLTGVPDPDPSNSSVSPEGRWLLYTKAAGSGMDLMLAENFR
jgi:hypothetical protein